jgi:hypothetical protein
MAKSLHSGCVEQRFSRLIAKRLVNKRCKMHEYFVLTFPQGDKEPPTPLTGSQFLERIVHIGFGRTLINWKPVVPPMLGTFVRIRLEAGKIIINHEWNGLAACPSKTRPI